MRSRVQPWRHSMPTLSGITPTRRTRRSAPMPRTLLLRMSCSMPSNPGAMTTQTSLRWWLLGLCGTSTEFEWANRNTAVRWATDCGFWAGRDPRPEPEHFCLMDPKPTKPINGSDPLPLHCPNHSPMLKTHSLIAISPFLGQWGSEYRRVFRGVFRS